MLGIRRARLERLTDQICLAEHAVQVQVEPGQPVARAEPETRRQDACVAVGIDDGQVRRVPGARLRPERSEERAGPPVGVVARERLRHFGQARSRDHTAAAERCSLWPPPLGLVAAEVGLADRSDPFVDELQERCGDRPLVDGACALVANQLERRDQARLLEQVTLAEEGIAVLVDPRPFAQRHHGRQHLQASGVRSRHRDAAPRERERRFDQPGPRQPPLRAPEHV